MQLSLKSCKAIATVSLLAIAPALVGAEVAFSQPIQSTTRTNVVVVNNNQNGFGGAYVGGGFSAGVTNGGQQEDAASLGGNIQGRIAPIPNVPVSARGAILFGPNNTAIMPMLTYDVPVAKNTNVYVGGGYSFVEKDGRNTPLGNKSAPVVTLGAEHSITRDIVVYGDAKVGIRAYENSSASALSLQGGVGYRF
jgi:hypothetical protein